LRIHVYTIGWNESQVIEYFLRHYELFAERIIIYDDNSTDGTTDILRRHRKVEVRPFIRTASDSFEISKATLLNNCWKESREAADWIIIVDCDEHVFHPRLAEYLAEQKHIGVTFVPTLGFQMVTELFPEKGEHLASSRTMGCPDPQYSKPCVFDPAAIIETNFSVGQHLANPVGRLTIPARDDVMLLHYKYLGIDYVVERYRALRPRRGQVDKANGWAYHFEFSAERWRAELANIKDRSVDIAGHEFSPSAAHDPPYWRILNSLNPAVKKLSRNDPCPCGSGRKFKHCHGRDV
jgi:glycosyltransferase involved in cell wall biosynthesis